MFNLIRNFKQFFILCFLIKFYVLVAGYEDFKPDFSFMEHVPEFYKEIMEIMENDTKYNTTPDPCSGLIIENNEPVFNFDEIFSEQNMTDLLQFLYENRHDRISAVHEKTVRVDCENVFFTTLDLESLGEHRIRLECIEDAKPNAINACIKQKASMALAQAYKPIYAGRIVKMNHFPHKVAIAYPANSSDPIEGIKYMFECGGTVISDRHVLTAAHCFKINHPVAIRLGVYHLKEPSRHYIFEQSVDLKISKIYEHPLYNRIYKYHDIALIELENPIPLSLAIYPACLDTDNNNIDGIQQFIFGWGVHSTDRKAKQDFDFRYGIMTTISRSECTELYKDLGKKNLGMKNLGVPEGFSEGQICATNSSADTCRGDSGGALQSAPGLGIVSTIYGVTSFGFRCGTGYPAVFTKVSYYRNWIESVVWPQTNDTISS